MKGVAPFWMKVPMTGTHTRSKRQGRLCRAGSRPHYGPQAELECPIRQPLLLLMGICTVTLTQTRWRDLGTMPKSRCAGLRGMGEMKLSAPIATLLSWVKVPKQWPCVSAPSLLPLEPICVHLIKTFPLPSGKDGQSNVMREMVRQGEYGGNRKTQL